MRGAEYWTNGRRAPPKAPPTVTGMQRRRRLTLSLVGAAAAVAVTVPLIAVQAGPGNGALLPDLVADPPDSPEFNVYSAGYDNSALLLRFNGYVHNAGDGPLDIQGNPQANAPAGTAIDQYLSKVPPNVAGPGGTTIPNPARSSLASGATAGNWQRVTDNKDPKVVFDNSDTHNHFHVWKAAEYTLWNSTKTAQVVAGSKVGFCMYDSEGDDTTNGPADTVYSGTVVTDFCDQGQPGATFLREGVSEGYRDIYDSSLDAQWVDVSNVSPGDYYLAARMDPEGYIKEKDENNGYTFSVAPVRVPGYRADAATAATGFRVAKTFALASTAFAPTTPIGSGGAPSGYAGLGTVRYRVETLPVSGTLRNGTAAVTAGTTLPAGVNQLNYTPGNNFSGQDSFVFSAVNYVNGAPTKYPLQPAKATATINVGGSGIVVNVSGIPGQMVVGTQAQFTGSATSGGITWAVDGVAGGNATVGTVTATGLYTAPASVPAGGKVTIQAVSTEDTGTRSAPVTVSIVGNGTSGPKPIITGTPRKPGVLAVGRNVTISVKVPSSGTITLSLLRGRARLGRCVTKVTAGQTATCKLQMPKPYDPGTLRVTSVFTSGGKTTRGSVSAGGSSFNRVSLKRRGGRVTLSVVPKRPGIVRVAITRRGRVVAQCTGRVLAGRTLTCSRSVGRGGVSLSISLKDEQGRLVIRQASL